MAVAFDIASNSKGNGVSSLTWAHTCTGSNMVLWVGVGSGATSPHNTSTVTYHAVSFTAENFDLLNSFAHVSGHYLKAPDTGSAFNIIATLAAADDEVIAGGASYTGVDQTTPIGTPNSATGATATPTVNITSASGELVVDAIYHAQWAAGTAHTAGAGQTARVDVADSGDGNGFLGMSEEAGAASVTMSWSTGPATQAWAIGGVSLKPAGAVADNVYNPTQGIFLQAVTTGAYF